MGLMIGLLIVRTIVVLLFGIEPAKRRLEEMKPDEVVVSVPVKA